jgi:hypothetical protein
MFLCVFLLTLFALTVLAAIELAAPSKKEKSQRHIARDRSDRECAIYLACIQAFKNH